MIIGISCHYHNAAAALVQDGVLVAAAEEERFTHVKNDPSSPLHAIRFCLKRAGVRPGALEYVVFYEKPLVKLERVVTSGLLALPSSPKLLAGSLRTWWRDRGWIRRTTGQDLGVASDQVLFVDHHLSHAASSFFSSPFREAAILTIDGVGEWTTAAMGRGEAKWDGTATNQLVLARQLRFPHSLGLLYSTFTQYLGFHVKSFVASVWRQYVQRLGRACGERGVPFVSVDAGQLIGWSFVDRVHLTDNGYQQVAERFARILNQGGTS